MTGYSQGVHFVFRWEAVVCLVFPPYLSRTETGRLRRLRTLRPPRRGVRTAWGSVEVLARVKALGFPPLSYSVPPPLPPLFPVLSCSRFRGIRCGLLFRSVDGARNAGAVVMSPA